MRPIKIKDVIMAGVFLSLVVFMASANANWQGNNNGDQQQDQGQQQGQGQAQGQGQQQDQISTNTNDNNSSAQAGAVAFSLNTAASGSSSDNEVNIAGDIYDIPSNSAFAPQPFSNMRCSSVLGAAFTNANGSGSLGIPVPRWLSRPLRDCERDADANWLAEMGMRLAAIEARCGTKSMQERFGRGYKGDEAARACVTELTASLRQEEVLKGLAAAVSALKDENRELVEEVVTLQRNQDICEEGADRAEGALRECWSK